MNNNERRNLNKKRRNLFIESGNQSGNHNQDLSGNFLTVEDVSFLLKISVQAVRKNCKSGKYETTTTTGRGGTRYLIALSSLPEHIQYKYKKENGLLIDVHNAMTEKPVISRNSDITPEMVKAVNRIKSGASYKDIAEQYGVNLSTVYRWRDKVDASKVDNRAMVLGKDITIIIPKQRKTDDIVFRYGISAFANDPKAGIKAAYGEAEKYAKANDLRIADYSNFYRAFKFAMQDSVIEMLIRGERGFEKNCQPKVVRKWLELMAYTVLCGDQKILDYEVMDYNTGEIINPNAYLWMDCSTRFISGVWMEAGNYNSFTVMTSLREALRYGLPERIFTDNGKPELSKRSNNMRLQLQSEFSAADIRNIARMQSELSRWVEIGGNAEFMQQYSDLNLDIEEPYFMEQMLARPYTPWHKPIENIMNIIERKMTDLHIPGYNKRTGDAWKDKEIMKKLTYERSNNKLLDIEEIVKYFYEAVKMHNHGIIALKELNGGKICPADEFLKGINEANRLKLDDVTLDYICMPQFKRKVKQATVTVAVRKGDTRTYHHRQLANFNCQSIQISVDPYDTEAPAILTDLQGNHIGVAELWSNQSFFDKAGLGKKYQTQKRLKDAVKKACDDARTGLGMIKTPISLTKTTAKARKAKAEIVDMGNYKKNKDAADAIVKAKAGFKVK